MFSVASACERATISGVRAACKARISLSSALVWSESLVGGGGSNLIRSISFDVMNGFSSRASTDALQATRDMTSTEAMNLRMKALSNRNGLIKKQSDKIKPVSKHQDLNSTQT